MEYLSASEQDTFQFAKQYAKKLKGGEVIGLIGDLGAGKTVFAKGLAAGLGIKRTVNSPTFVLMKIYPIDSRVTRSAYRVSQKKHSTLVTLPTGQVGLNSKLKYLVHIDAYRVKSPAELLAIGINDYLSRPDTVTVIEWADKIKSVLPLNAIHISFCLKNKNTRIINY